MRAHPVMQFIQEATEPHFNGLGPTVFGPLNYGARRGTYVPPRYAVMLGGEPLGVMVE